MEYESKRPLVHEEIEIFEEKVKVFDVREVREDREIHAEIHHEDGTEHTSVKKKHDASIVFPSLKSSLSLTETSPLQDMQLPKKMDSEEEAVVSKTEKINKNLTLPVDDQLVKASESSLLVNQKEQRFSSVKVLVQPKISSQCVSSDQYWTDLFSPMTAVPPQKEKPRSFGNDISTKMEKIYNEDILPLEQSTQPTSHKDTDIHKETIVSFLGNKMSGALFKGVSDFPTTILPQTKVFLPEEGYQCRKPSAMGSDKTGPAEAQTTRDDKDPNKERAEKLQKGICFS